MRFYNYNLTLWENLCNFLIVLVVFGAIFLICHLVEKAKEKKAADNRRERERNNITNSD